MITQITRYRGPRARVAIAYSTKDRTEFTQTTIGRLIGNAAFDLYWFDGSVTDEGRALPGQICAGAEAACELHQGVVGGPDSAIIYALRMLQPRNYDLTILVENDVLLSEGWYEAILASMERATHAGFRVGAATPRLYAQRVLSFNGDHCLLVNSGAGCIALTHPAIAVVLDNYRTVDATEFFQRFEALTGLDLQSTVEFSAAQRLSCDFFFDLVLYLHGYVVTSPPITYAMTIDGSDTAESSRHHLVATADDHLPEVRERITRPDQIKAIPYPFFRFPRSAQSTRLVVGCHQLSVEVNKGHVSSPVRANGQWRRRWVQSIGPFTLYGSGQVSIDLYKSVVGLLIVTGNDPAALHITTSAGNKFAYELPTNILGDFALNTEDIQSTSVDIDLTGGDVAIVGLTVDADMLAYYANVRASIDHLPS